VAREWPNIQVFKVANLMKSGQLEEILGLLGGTLSHLDVMTSNAADTMLHINRM